jgi:hypothetical protein
VLIAQIAEKRSGKYSMNVLGHPWVNTSGMPRRPPRDADDLLDHPVDHLVDARLLRQSSRPRDERVPFTRSDDGHTGRPEVRIGLDQGLEGRVVGNIKDQDRTRVIVKRTSHPNHPRTMKTQQGFAVSRSGSQARWVICEGKLHEIHRQPPLAITR